MTDQIRLAIPSKGRLQSQTEAFFEECGISIGRQSRNYLGTISGFPDVQVVYQRATDIVRGVNNGLLTFGITGYDLTQEIPPDDNNIILIHEELDFGKCTLEVAIPEEWEINSIDELSATDETYRVATKFSNLAGDFFDQHDINYEFVEGAGTLEVSPALGNSDIIVDLVSTGRTLSANRLKQIDGGKIISSQGVFIGNRNALQNDETLNTARRLLEYFEATLRAEQYLSVHANMKGEDPIEKAKELFDKNGLEGLQGPTVSPVVSRQNGDWFAVHIIVAKDNVMNAIESLREIGGSGVVATETKYIFEANLDSYQALLDKL